MKFTKAPWGYDSDDRVIVAGEKDIAHMDGMATDDDAMLIKAAPDLYAELLYAVVVAENQRVLGDTWLERARLVLAKAAA